MELDKFDESVIEMIKKERIRQNEKWGEQHHTYEQWREIFKEEFQEAKTKYVCETPPYEYIVELVESAAVLHAWIRDIIKSNRCFNEE